MLREEADMELHEVIEQSLLIARDEIVADPGEHNGLTVRRCPADHEGDDDRAAYDDNEVGTAVVEYLVDHIPHDPGAERCGACDRDQADRCEYVGRNVRASVFGDHPPDHCYYLAGIAVRSSALAKNHVLRPKFRDDVCSRGKL